MVGWALRGSWRRPTPSCGGRRPRPLRRRPWVSFGTAAARVTYDRTVARSPIARTRQVTVTTIICGVDVSSATLDACIGRDGPTRRFARTAEGIEALAAFCLAHGAGLVAMEATGGYERLPFTLLWTQHGLPCALLNPRAVRRFAEAMGFLEKTDRIDAGLIAWFAEVRRVLPQQPPHTTQEQLEALVTRLRQLTALKTAQSNQRRLVQDPTALASIDELLAFLTRQIRSFEAEIARLIDGDPLWRELDRTLRSIKGVADRTVARLMAEMPEIGTLSNKAIAKLAGLAPLARDSGKVSGKRPVRGGRRAVRSILFVVAEIVRRFEPDFIAFHAKLNQAGKPKKVIRIALARKLLVRLNAKARDARRQLAQAT
jgi:transposase